MTDLNEKATRAVSKILVIQDYFTAVKKRSKFLVKTVTCASGSQSWQFLNLSITLTYNAKF